MLFLKCIGIAVAALVALFILAILFTTVCAYVIKPVYYDRDSRFYRFLLVAWIRWLFAVCRIHIRVEGAEKVPVDTPFLFVSNHRSKFDPMAAWIVFNRSKIAFISKESNFHIPWFGRIIRKCCCMAIDREDPRKAIATINHAASLLESGEVSVGVYPEGTRSTECVLLPFHSAVFKIAQKAGAPIVVTTIEGTEKINKNFIRHRTDVTIKVLDVITPYEIAEAKRSSVISDRVYETISNSLKSKEEEVQ